MTNDQTQATIAGEPATIGDFSAYKAITAMEIVSEVEGAFRAVLSEAATYKAKYEAENVVTYDRAEARRQFRPRPLYKARQVIGDDGETIVEVVEEPVLGDDGKAVLGPDPLGHLTDQDWNASGNVLKIGESPTEEMMIAAMVPIGFRLGRVQVLRLVALALTSNGQLEEWDGQEDLNGKLDEAARKLLHRARADELVDVAIAVMRKCKDQLAGPFERAREAIREIRPQKTTAPDPEIEPMRIETETDDSGSSATSSTESQAATAGRPETSSIASPSGG